MVSFILEKYIFLRKIMIYFGAGNFYNRSINHNEIKKRRKDVFYMYISFKPMTERRHISTSSCLSCCWHSLRFYIVRLVLCEIAYSSHA